MHSLSRFFQKSLLIGTLGLLLSILTSAAASPYAGFYSGYVYFSVSGTITVPESTTGAAAFTVDDNGIISGSITGTVNGSGAITWNANSTGFTTGTISGGILATTTSQNNNGAISTTRISASNSTGFGNGSVGKSLVSLRPSPTGANMLGVTYGGGQFVAVGASGNVAISGNGTNWVAVNTGTNQQLNAVAYGNSTYVAVGNAALVISSPDGSTWTVRSTGASAFQNFNGVAFGNGTFVAVNIVGQVLTSTDGASWSIIGSPPSGTWNNIKYVGGVFVLVGISSGTGAIATSSDGTSWNTVKTISSTSGVLDVAFGNSKWVAVNNSGSFTFAASNASDATYTAFSGLGDAVGFVNGVFVSDKRYFSSDGFTWNRLSYPNMDVNDIVTQNGLMVAVGAAMTTTTDGKIWGTQTKVLPLPTVNNVGVNGPLTGDYFDEITFNYQGNGRFARIGLNGLIQQKATSNGVYTNAPSPTSNHLRDAINILSGSGTAIVVGDNGTLLKYGAVSGVEMFTNVVSGVTANLHALAFNDPVVVAVGDGGTILRSANAGQTWGTVSSGTANNLNQVAFLTGTGFNYFVAVGDNGNILKSTDGTSWTKLTTGTTKKLVGIFNMTVPNAKLVAVAEDSTIVVSEDSGVTWRSITINAPYAITYGNSSTARGVGGFVMSTSDGTNWSYSLPLANNITAATYGNGRFVLVGDVNRLVSSDLENWTSVPTPYSHFGITFGNGVFVTVGQGTALTNVGYISTSVDGFKWIDRPVPTQTLLNAVTYGQGKFIAVGASGTILSSTDGITWVNRTITGAQELRGVTYGNNLFIAVGAGGVTRYSTDGETWTAGTAGGTQLNSVAYGNGLYVAVGDNRTIQTSGNGTTWTSQTTTPATPAGRILRSVRYVGDRFIIVGDQDSGNALVIHSTNGTVWTKDGASIAFNLYSEAAGNGTFITGGDSGTLLTAPYQNTNTITFTSQPTPVSQTVSANATVTYTATVQGSNLQYRWIKDGTPLVDGPGISGATTASLTLTGVDVLDTGVYYLSAYNDSNSALSQALTLNVNGAPIVTIPPVSVTTSNTFTTNFTVTATGPGTFTYHWRKNGTPLSDIGHYSGTATKILTITGATGADEASYDVIVSNSFGDSAPSAAAMLFVKRPPTITVPPVGTNIVQGQNFTLTVVADGSATMGYQWKHNGVNLTDGAKISGSTNATLVITGAAVVDGGGYTVTVTNAFNPAATSSSVYVSVLGPGALHPGFTFNGVGVGTSAAYDIAATSDGQFVVGGDFNITSGFTWSRLVKIDSNGVPNATFATTNAANIPNGIIRSVIPQADNQLVIGGGFSQWGGASYTYSARLSAGGVVDSGFKPALALIVKKAVPVANGKVLIGRTGLGFSTSYVMRYNSDGTTDGSFTEIVNANRELFGLAVQSDGTIWLSGTFGLKKANANGTSPTAVTTYAPFGEMTYVHVGPDDKIYYSDNNGQYLGRLNADGSRDTSFVMTITGHVTDMAFLSNGNIVIVGDFPTVNSTTMAYIAVLDNTGALVSGFTSPYTWASGGGLNSISMVSDGSALVAGNVQLTLPTVQRFVQRVQIGNPPAVGTTYAQWVADKGLNAGVNDGLSDDADGDGFKNAVEYAFATNPNLAGSVPVFEKITVNDTGTDYPAVRITVLKDALDVTVTVTAASDATFLNSVSLVKTEVDQGTTKQVTYRSTIPKSSTPQVFFRIVVAGTVITP